MAYLLLANDVTFVVIDEISIGFNPEAQRAMSNHLIGVQRSLNRIEQFWWRVLSR